MRVISLFIRLKEYGLDDPEDGVANYMILSLMNDQMSPALQVISKWLFQIINEVNIATENISCYVRL